MSLRGNTSIKKPIEIFEGTILQFARSDAICRPPSGAYGWVGLTTESWSPYESFTDDWRIPFFAEDALLKWYVEEDEAEDPVQVDEADREDHQWMQNSGYLR